jgi:hypothetical protein
MLFFWSRFLNWRFFWEVVYFGRFRCDWFRNLFFDNWRGFCCGRL